MSELQTGQQEIFDYVKNNLGDGSGQTIQEVPVRVGSSPSIDLYSKGDWLVNNSHESMPTAWIENTGNEVNAKSDCLTSIVRVCIPKIG